MTSFCRERDGHARERSACSSFCRPRLVLAFVLLMPVMPFSFSFTLTVPGLTNPFSSPPEPEPAPPTPRLARLDAGSDIQGYRSTAPIRRAPSPSLQPPLSRKRGWVPSAPEYSSPTANPTSTSGYLDTPAKYREMASAYDEGDEVEEMVAGECLICLYANVRFQREYTPVLICGRVKTSTSACGLHVFGCRHS